MVKTSCPLSINRFTQMPRYKYISSAARSVERPNPRKQLPAAPSPLSLTRRSLAGLLKSILNSADNLSRTLFAQNTTFRWLGTAISALLPIQKREHAATGAFSFSRIARAGRGGICEIAPAPRLIKDHLDSTSFTRLSGSTSGIRRWGRTGITC